MRVNDHGGEEDCESQADDSQSRPQIMFAGFLSAALATGFGNFGLKEISGALSIAHFSQNRLQTKYNMRLLANLSCSSDSPSPAVVGVPLLCMGFGLRPRASLFRFKGLWDWGG